jgi:hypothetical protein
MVIHSILATVEKGRLAKAAEAYATGVYSIALVYQKDEEICGLVSNGDGAGYEVVLTLERAFCGCPDAQFRHSTCKHGALLALHAIHTPKAEAKEEQRPVNLKLGKVRTGFAFAA